jgi:glycosyltransferase involved in cell wall biosynthesis
MNLALFFTIGVSLKTWQKIGMLSREIRPYNFLAKNFKKIYFITYGGKEDLELKKDLAENIEVLPKKFLFLPSLIYALLIPFIYQKELKEVDIYKTNQMAGSPPAILAKWFYKKRLIVRCGYEWLFFSEKKKNILKRMLVYFLEKVAYKTANKIILTSERDKKFIESKFKTPLSKIELIPNYIDIELFKPLGIPKEKNRICFVGGLSPQKNPFNLLKAVDGLDVKLVLFGKEEMGGKLKEKAEKIKKAKIEFRGNIPNNQLPEELNKSELFILPSLYEGNPKVLLEAMACGLPVIGTNVEGIREIVKHKENGYLCGTDSNSIRKAIIEVLDNKELQEKMGKRARQTILESFDLGKILEKEIKIYETL